MCRRGSPAICPELQLSRLEGRLGWNDDGKQSSFYMRSLSFEEKNGVRFEPTDLKVAMRAGEHGIESGRVEFARLDLLPLRELAVALPLPVQWRDALARFSPSGVLENGDMQWRGDAENLRTVSGSGRFAALSIAAYDTIPGIAGSKRQHRRQRRRGAPCASTATAWCSTCATRSASALRSTTHWEPCAGTTSATACASMSTSSRSRTAMSPGRAKGSYITTPGERGRADLSAQLTRVDGRQIYHYISPQVDDKLRKWLQKSVQAGSVSDASRQAGRCARGFPVRRSEKRPVPADRQGAMG